MVNIERDIDTAQCTAQCRFILRPNRSLSWRGSLIFFFSLCVVSGSIAIGLGLLGFWLVLPFAGLELLGLGIGLYIVAQRCQQCEVISIAEESIRIERGKRYPCEQWILARFWAQVVLERCPKQWYPSRLLIRSQGRVVEIGKFLNEQERQHLAKELARSL